MGGKLKLAVPKGDPQEATEKEEKTMDTNQETQPAKPTTFTKNGIEIYSDSRRRNLNGIWQIIIALVGSIAIFEGTYWLLSNFDIPYYLISIVAVIFSFMLIQIYNKATGDMPSLLRIPIIFLTIIIFVLSLFIGYHHSEGKSAGNLDKVLWTAKVHDNNFSSDFASKDEYNYQKQFGIVKTSGEIWVADNLPKKTIVTVKIRGAAVLVNGEYFLPSDYAVKTNSNGQIIFEGIKRITTSIEVIP